MGIIKCLHDSVLPLDLRLQTGDSEMPFRPQKVPFGQIKKIELSLEILEISHKI